MLKWLKGDPLKKLEKEHARKLEEAMAAQRGGNMPRFATLSAEAEEIGKKIDELRAEQK